MQFFKLTMFLILILAVSVCGCMAPSPAPVQNTTTSTTSVGSGNWTFAVLGDSPDPATNTTTGVSPNLSPIARAVAADKPDLVVYNGDLINGWGLTNESPMMGNYSGQFGNWMEAVSPIYNYTTGTGIPLYVLRGNHEDGLNQTVTPLLDAYLSTVASGMPVNGPPGEEKLTYSVTHKGAKFIVTDDYSAHDGLKETVNQSWIDGQLTQDTRPFMFVFGHSPAYLLENETDVKSDENPFSLSIYPAQRDTLWKSLVNNNGSAYFCGHIHTYARGVSQGVQQIVCGNGGAQMVAFDPTLAETGLTTEYPLKAIAIKDQKVGYLLITVHEDSRTFDGVQKVFNPGTQSWEVGDTFTIHAR